MSLYNSLFGRNKETPVLLGMLGVNEIFFNRFRDVELIEKGTKIRVFIRTGGNNREFNKENWQEIRNHKQYITDYDDDFDDTYAYIEFKVPEKYEITAKSMFEGEPESFREKFNKALGDIDKEGTQSNEVAKKIASQINNAIDGNDTIKIIKI